MRPLISPNNKPMFIRSDDNFFQSLRIFRDQGQAPRLFFMTSPSKSLTFEGAEYLEYDSCELCYGGEESAESIKNGICVSPGNITYLKQRLEASNMGKRIPASLDKFFKQICDTHFLTGYGVLETMPAQISHDPMEYCLAFVDDTKIVEGPFEHWKHFLSQMPSEDYQKAYAAFLYASLDPVNFGRQILILYDLFTGKTGKSAVSNAIQQVLSRVSQSLAFSSRDDFILSSIYGRRLLFFPDCKYADIFSGKKGELLHSISGNDYMLVEFKGQTAFNARMYARVVVSMNEQPNIDAYKAHQSSRVIVIPLDAASCTDTGHYRDGVFVGNNFFTDHLVSEFYHFLYYARDCYTSLCPTRREILVSNLDCVGITVSDSSDNFDEIFSNVFEFTGSIGDFIRVSKVNKELLINGTFRESPIKIKQDFKAYLMDKGTKPSVLDGYPVYRGIKLKNSQPLSSADMLELVGSDATSEVF